MKEKLNLQEIIDLLSRETGATKKDTDIFLKNLFSIISETLLQDQIVKIKGIGTFKLIQVEKRESVNVNTKEKYEIPAHYKLNFIPDAGMKALVNEPFSAFEPVEIQSENTNPEKQTPEETQNNEQKTTKEIPNEEPKSKEKNAQKEKIKNEIEQSATIRKKEFKKKKDTRKNRLNSIILFLAIGIIAIMGYQWINHTIEEKKATRITVKTKTDHTKQIQSTHTIPTQNNEQKETPQNTPSEPKTKEQQTIEKSENTVATTKLLDKIILEEGNRLTLIAEKYYGHKIFWVYLYEANKTRIKNPNNIPVGTLIEIPSPEIYDINVHNAESIRKASNLSAEIIETFN